MLIHKIIGHRAQDKLGNCEMFTNNYSTRDCLLDSFGRTCKECKRECIYTIHANGAITSNITADRINNNISHSRDNCNV
jgi:hypothetical protein